MSMTPQRILSTILAAGFLVAPAIALLYGRQPGLVVLAVALFATIALAWSARDSIEPKRRVQLDRLLLVNGVLLALTLAGLILVS